MEQSSVFKNGIFSYQYTAEDGEPRAVYAKTIEDLETKLTHELGFELPNKVPSLYEEIQVYLQYKSNIKESTRNVYTTWADKFKNDPLFIRSIKRIKTPDIKRWIVDLQKKGYSSNTISLIFTGIVKPSFQLAVEEELINRNPADIALGSLIKNTKKERMALTEDEQIRLLNYIQKSRTSLHYYYEAIVFLLETGLRVGELCGLTLDDVDLKKGELTVNRQLRVVRKGEYLLQSPKSKAGHRTIPLTNKAKEVLRKTIKRMPETETEIDGVKGFIFRNSRGDLLDSNTLGKVFRKATYSLGLNDVSLHNLRHTFCTNYIQKGMSIKGVQYLMGHESAKVTLDVYSHMQADQIREEFKSIQGK